MVETTFKELGLELKVEYSELKINDAISLQVRSYLPIEDKGNMITYIVNSAIDDSTGCFSPIRVEVYFALAVCKWYAGLVFEDLSNPGMIYDILDTNGIIQEIMKRIPTDELDFIQDLVKDTISDIARYNSSAAGIIQMMNQNAGDLNTQITDILEKIKNGENLETLSVIKDVVGKD